MGVVDVAVVRVAFDALLVVELARFRDGLAEVSGLGD